MAIEPPPQPELFTLDMLTHAVRNALGEPDGALIDWDCQPIYGGASALFGAIAGVYRVSGHMRADGVLTPWSLALKVLGKTAHGDDPASAAYWRRESLVHQSPLREYLPAGLAMPLCFAVTENETTSWLWLEDLGEMRAARWGLDEYANVAYLLGQFNATFLAHRPLPQWDWLSRRWLRSWVQSAAPEAARLPALRDHPLIQRWFPPGDFARIVALWDQREAGLQILERLPHTLCHLDANRRNLIRRQGQAGAAATTLIDWAGCGIAAIGEELAWLVWASYFMFEVDPTEIDQLEAATFEQYVAGLRDAGWQGDEREVRIGYALGSAFRNATALGLDTVLDAEQRSGIEQVSGRSLEECLDRWADVNRRALDNLDALGL